MKAILSPRALLVLLLATFPLAADLVKYKEWVKSPEYVYLATDDEKKAWRSVTTDEQGDKFLALFWARRNPDLKNPANEFKSTFDARVAKADELFKLRNKRGALTERGKLFILIGPPKTMAKRGLSAEDAPASAPGMETTRGRETWARASSQGQAQSAPGMQDTRGREVMGSASATDVMHYDREQLPPWSDVPSLDARFQVDEVTAREHVIDLAVARRLEAVAVEKALVNPQLKEPPVYKLRAEAEAEAKAQAQAQAKAAAGAAAGSAAEAAKGPVLSAPVRKALEDAAAPSSEGLSLFPVAYANGVTRLMTQLFVPAEKATAPDLKFGLLVRSKDGKDAARKEEPAALAQTKSDYFTDRIVTIPGGDYDVTAGLFDAAGSPVLIARGSVTVPQLPTGFAVSPLFLACNDYDAPTAQPEDPFLFFQRKFVSKGRHKFDGKTDGLSWVVRVYNPTVDASRKVTLKKTVTVIRSGNPETRLEVPQEPITPVTVPESAGADPKSVVLDLAGGIVEGDLAQYFAPEDVVKVVITDMGSPAEPKPSVEATASLSIATAPRGPAPARKK